MPRPKLNINYAYQSAVSYSQYSMYKNCPYQWYLSYVKKHSSFKPSIYLTYGTSFHETLQEYIKVMYEESAKKADEIDLADLLKQRMVENYKITLEENKGEHFSTPEELKEFLSDGVATLEWFKKNRSRYFSKKDTDLVGIEIPILQPVLEENPNVFMNGFIDFILYDKASDLYTIYDIKTSTRGWNDKEKKDQTKINQVLLYKRFYSKTLNIPEDKIEVKFFIVKRKVFEGSEYPIHRVQEFVPANGKKKVQSAVEDFSKFIRESFTDKAKHNTERVYQKNTSNCKYCPFNDKPELCDKS